MEKLEKEVRSRIMSSVKSKNTSPEVTVRRVLHSMGYRFRLHRRDLPGTPDIVLPKYKIAIFVHGCFWHQHAGCHRATFPKSRQEFWLKKFQTNIDRDSKAEYLLHESGWKVETIWECETKCENKLLYRLELIFNVAEP